MSRVGSGRRIPSAGFSLVELMIAMVLGLFLIGGTITVFLGNLTSSEFSQAIAHLQAKARFVIDDMTRDIRSSGYRGCAGFEVSALSIRTNKVAGSSMQQGSIGGSRVTGSGWEPALPSGLGVPTGAGAPVLGTDVVFVQYGAAPGAALISSMNSTAADLTVELSGTPFEAGQLAIVSDCASADLFEIDAIATSTSSVTINPADNLSQAYNRFEDFPASTRVLPLVSNIYYVGNSGRENATGEAIRSLYLQSWPHVLEDNPPLELIEGVDQLQVRFGIDRDDGSRVFVGPESALYDPARISTIEIGLLLTSVENLLEAAATREFMLAGTLVSPSTADPTADTASYPADRRLRVPVNITIKLRNRGLQDRAT